MGDTNYKYYKIDLADIWEYEREKFLNGITNEELALKILELIRPFILKYGEPSFGEKMHIADPEYYGRNVISYQQADLKMRFALNYFIHKNDCYEYNQSIVISRENDAFPFFFALKLRQYNDNLYETRNFLLSNLIIAFDDDIELYLKHLKLVQFQYSGFFGEGLTAQIKEFNSIYEAHIIQSGSSSKGMDNSRKQTNTSTIDNLKIKKLKDQKVDNTLENPDKNRNLKIWAGTAKQLDLLYDLINKKFIDSESKVEFIKHFTGETFQKKINWIVGNDAFIELFDRLATSKLINQMIIKQNNQFKTRKVIMTKHIVQHFIFKGFEKKAEVLNKSRYQFYQTSSGSEFHDFITDLLKTLEALQ